MAARTAPPFRADHVGSLLRPAALLKAREDKAAGRIDAGQLRLIEDEAITAVVAMQEEIGLQSATDDEQVAKLRLITDVARDVWGWRLAPVWLRSACVPARVDLVLALHVPDDVVHPARNSVICVGAPVKIFLDHASGTPLAKAEAGYRGVFFATVTIPASAKPGSHVLIAVGSDGAQASTTITVS